MMTGNVSLLALLLLLSCMHATHAFVICLVTNPGFSECNPLQDPFTYRGIDVDLMRWIAVQDGWKEIADASNLSLYPPESRTFSFLCTSRRVTSTVNILIENGTMGECAMGMGAWTITTDRIYAGCRFSYPYIRTGLGIIVNKEGASPTYNIWAFTEPFHWTLWATLGATLLLLPPITWLVENLVTTGSLPIGHTSMRDLQVAIFHFFLSVFNLNYFACLTLPAQLIIVTFLFMILVCVSTYTANLAAALTVAVSINGINSLADLSNKQNAAHDPYIPMLRRYYRINARNITWMGPSTFIEVSAMLQNDSLTSYIFDKPILEYYIANMNISKACTLGFVGDAVLPFDYGFGFHKEFPSKLIEEINFGVLAAEAANELVLLEDAYIMYNDSMCLEGSSTSVASIHKLAGLWIILACAVAIGILSSMYSIWKFHVKGGKLDMHLPHLSAQPCKSDCPDDLPPAVDHLVESGSPLGPITTKSMKTVLSYRLSERRTSLPEFNKMGSGTKWRSLAERVLVPSPRDECPSFTAEKKAQMEASIRSSRRCKWNAVHVDSGGLDGCTSQGSSRHQNSADREVISGKLAVVHSPSDLKLMPPSPLAHTIGTTAPTSMPVHAHPSCPTLSASSLSTGTQ